MVGAGYRPWSRRAQAGGEWPTAQTVCPRCQCFPFMAYWYQVRHSHQLISVILLFNVGKVSERINTCCHLIIPHTLLKGCLQYWLRSDYFSWTCFCIIPTPKDWFLFLVTCFNWKGNLPCTFLFLSLGTEGVINNFFLLSVFGRFTTRCSSVYINSPSCPYF